MAQDLGTENGRNCPGFRWFAAPLLLPITITGFPLNRHFGHAGFPAGLPAASRQSCESDGVIPVPGNRRGMGRALFLQAASC